MKPQIKIEPNEYKGWSISFTDTREDNNFTAQKSNAYLFGHSLQELLFKVDKHERLIVKFSKPIKCLWKDGHGFKFEPIEINAVCGETIYFSTNDGKQKTRFMPDLRPDQAKARGSMARIYILDSTKNNALLKKGCELKKKANELNKQAEELAGKVIKLTAADIFVAAKLDNRSRLE